MTPSSSPGARPRPLLHPVTAAAVLGLLGAVGVFLTVLDAGGAVLLLTAVVGAAAGFANSGST